MQPLDDFDPPVGVAQPLGAQVLRILAPNPSPMTYRGTNTYLVGTRHLAVIDPGPADASHMKAILQALKPGQDIAHILVTHAHLDHSPLARDLSALTGAPVYAYGSADAGRSAVMTELAATGLVGGGEGVDIGFSPDFTLKDGERIVEEDWEITAHWTPGHFGNHLSFALYDMVFTGDLVMGWASSLVSPPDGDLTDFMASCHKLQDLGASVFHAGHGAPIADPATRLGWLIRHRQAREAAILAKLRDAPTTASSLTQAIYTDTPARLIPAARRNVLAHLIDLYGKKRVAPKGTLTADAVFMVI